MMNRKYLAVVGIGLAFAAGSAALLAPGHGKTHLDIFKGQDIYLASDEPVVKPGRMEEEFYTGFSLQPTDSFSISGIVLSRMDYDDKNRAISPTDLVIGWGQMSNPILIEDVPIRQAGRAYSWDGARGLSDQEITRSSANIHVIVENAEDRKALKSIRRGDMVSLEGVLVHVSKEDGYQWQTSRSMTDEGKNSSEILKISSISIN